MLMTANYEIIQQSFKIMSEGKQKAKVAFEIMSPHDRSNLTLGWWRQMAVKVFQKCAGICR